jgi:hypothetical protein
VFREKLHIVCLTLVALLVVGCSKTQVTPMETVALVPQATVITALPQPTATPLPPSEQVTPTETVTLVLEATIVPAPPQPTATSLAPPEGEFSIHLLAQHVSASHLSGVELDSLEFEAEPILSVDDIVAYREETHEIELTASAYERIEQLEVPTNGLPFVVCVGRKPIYSGAFWAMFSSLSFDGVTIWVPLIEEHIIQMKLGYPQALYFKGEDPRSDSRILRSLEQVGKLK